MRAMFPIVGQHVNEFDGIGEVALIVGFGGRDDRRRSEIALRGSRLHDKTAAEQFADQWLKNKIGSKILLEKVSRAHDRFDRLARSLPDGILEPMFLSSILVETFNVKADLGEIK